MANVTFTPNPQPAPACYPGDVNGLLNLLTTGGGINGTIPDNAGGGVYVGSAPPSSSLTNKVWFKTDVAGRPIGTYMFYNGNWRKVYTGAALGEIRMAWYYLGFFDGSGLGIVGGDYDGWAICNGGNGTPNLIGYFPAGGAQGEGQGAAGTWLTDVDGQSWKASGGVKGITTLSAANLPPLMFQYFHTSGQAGGDYAALVADGTKPTAYGWVVEADTKVPVEGAPQPLPYPVHFMAVGFIMFVGYT